MPVDSVVPTASLPVADLYRDTPLTAPVLLIGEDDGFCSDLARHLTTGGRTVRTVRGGLDRLTHARGGAWQAVIVHFGASSCECLEPLRALRRTNNVPVLLVGIDTVAGLEAGADACLPEGSSPRQIAARLQAVTRRAAPPQELVIADLRITPESRRVRLSGNELALTRGEFDLLLSLAQAYGRVKTRADLYAEFHARAYGATDRSVDVQMSGLRRKLGDDPKNPRFIRTVRSAGYMLVRPEAP